MVDLEDCDGDSAVVLARLVFSPSIDLFESIIYNYNMKAQKITKKQQAFLNFLEDFTEENGYYLLYEDAQQKQENQIKKRLMLKKCSKR